MDTSHHFFLLLMFLHYAICMSSYEHCAKILPDSTGKIFVEVGKNFTATCHLKEGSDYTINDMEWIMDNITLPKQNYHKINESSISVTVNVSSNMNGWLMCITNRKFPPHKPYCTYGIKLLAGYPPVKPENLTCIALQKEDDVSPYLECYWDPGTRKPLLDTTYTLNAEIVFDKNYSASCNPHPSRSCTVNLMTFPHYMYIRVWVEVKNALGSVWSDKLFREASDFVKPSPPMDVQVLAENNFSTSLMVIWKCPFKKTVMNLSYVIRYCQADSKNWTEVPQSLSQTHSSFRLQSLEPYTEYVVQMRCIPGGNQIYWSDWSANATVRTPEDKPASAPDLWRYIQSTPDNRNVKLVWKPPVKANGKILNYDLGISQDNRMFAVKADNLSHMFSLPPGKEANIEITANNSVGVSPKATLFIPSSDQERPGVESLSWWVHDEKLQVEWSGVPPLRPSEYLLEWVNVQEKKPQPHWQRVPHNVNTSTLTGFEKLMRYNISVYPIYKHRFQGIFHIQAGRPVTVAAYIQQGSPKQAPTLTVTKSKKNSAELTWGEIPLESQCGFITNYTIFYKIGNTEQYWQSVVVGPNVRSHVLTDLASATDYMVHLMASTVAGSINGSNFNFKTMKYGDGEVEVIIVVVCLSFLFLTVFIIMICLRKREVIKQLLWPQVPDPSDSSIAHWSPDFPIKQHSS